MTTTTVNCAVIGRGRLGSALAAALGTEPLGRDACPHDAGLVLLCVPDGEIATAAAAIAPRDGLLVGHCSGATTLAPLAPHEAFSLHPLMTVTADGADFNGVPAAIAGSTERAATAAQALARTLGMSPFAVADEDRAAYHAGATVASNYLLTLLDLAERLAGTDRRALELLIRASVDNWLRTGAAAALTGPVARGDEDTVGRQRAAVAGRTPADLELFDALTDRTRALAEVAA
ncbi:MAG: DUF2520 domain-containing protein [Baekduia sp.]